VVTFQPGVRIDYPHRQVEADGRVVLREGLLELFACSPGTREYESIVCLDARPVAIYQALGLLGLQPGRPLSLDAAGQVIPADGQPIRIDVRYPEGGRPRTLPAEAWMRRTGDRAALEPLQWVFAGSFPVGPGTTPGRSSLAADEEGTIVAVVDFESAVIALARPHSASNAELWLEPNTPAIPPVGTRCTLIFRPGPWQLRLDATGRFYVSGRAATVADTLRRLRDALAQDPQTVIELDVDPSAPADERERLSTLLSGLGARVRSASRPATASAPASTHPPVTDDRLVARWLVGLATASGPAPGDNAESRTASRPARPDSTVNHGTRRRPGPATPQE
jgi:hypothetical protein